MGLHIQMLSKIPVTCPYANPSPNALNMENYDRLHWDGRQLIRTWFTRAYKQVDCVAEHSFEPFIFAWISFNAWGSCITGEDRDIKWIRRVAKCPRLRETFGNLSNIDQNFQTSVQSFVDLWPIFRAQDIRRSEYYGERPLDRAEVIQTYYRIQNISYEPSCSLYHTGISGSIPADWPHCLHTIYRVRCNLFHGEKSPHSEMDARIVKSAFDVLVGFLAKADIISPNLRTHRPLRERRAGEP